MTKKEALRLVLELADDSAIDPDDEDNDVDRRLARKQQAAITIVQEIYAKL